MRFVDVRLNALMRTELDGIPLDLASRMLPRRTWFQWGIAVHIHAHAASQRRQARRPSNDRDAEVVEPQVSPSAALGLIESLLAVVRKRHGKQASSMRSQDYQLRPSYTDASMEAKRRLVRHLEFVPKGSTIWDLGSNTGQFARLAAETRAHELLRSNPTRLLAN